jgi:CRP-like cAMP-binding protein
MIPRFLSRFVPFSSPGHWKNQYAAQQIPVGSAGDLLGRTLDATHRVRTPLGKEAQPQKMLPKVSQEMLAEMVGTTRSRVNFFMNKFRKLGFIRYNGEIHINNSLLSVVLHE